MIRHARMQGRPALFLPGLDHASIAAQVVLDRVIAAEGETRASLGRDHHPGADVAIRRGDARRQQYVTEPEEAKKKKKKKNECPTKKKKKNNTALQCNGNRLVRSCYRYSGFLLCDKRPPNLHLVCPIVSR